MLVVHVLPQDLNRGAQVYAGKLRDQLRGDESQEHVVVTLFQGPEGGARPDVALNVPLGLGRRLLDLRAAMRLGRLIRRRDAGLVVAHGGEALKYVVAASGRRPTAYYKVGLSTAEIQRPLHRMLYRFLSWRTSLVVGNSRAILRQVEEVFGIPKSRQALIPNGRDPDVYRPLEGGEVPAVPPRLLFVGQLEPGKRPDLYLYTVERLRMAGHSFDAAIVGDGPMKLELAARSEALGVQLLGTRSDVPTLIRESSVLILTSALGTEGMPGVLIESGMSGVPVVSTAAAGVEDIVVNGVTGWVVDEEEELAARVGELLANPGLRFKQGTAAREWCIANFSLHATARLWRREVAVLFRDTWLSAEVGSRIGEG